MSGSIAGVAWAPLLDARQPQRKGSLLLQRRPAHWMHVTCLINMLYMHSKMDRFLVDGIYICQLLRPCSNTDMSQVLWTHCTWISLLLYRHLLQESHSETQHPCFWQTYPPDFIILYSGHIISQLPLKICAALPTSTKNPAFSGCCSVLPVTSTALIVGPVPELSQLLRIS